MALSDVMWVPIEAITHYLSTRKDLVNAYYTLKYSENCYFFVVATVVCEDQGRKPLIFDDLKEAGLC